MTDKLKELGDRLNSMVASQFVLQHLAMALFDAIDDKQRVITQFEDTTEKSHIHALYSTMPQVFFNEFEEQKKVLLLLLKDAQD